MKVTSLSTCCSLFEGPLWKSVEYCVQEGLVGRIASSQGVEADSSGDEIDLDSDEPMNPVPVDGERVAEQAGLSPVVGTAYVDQGSLWMFLQIQPPVFRERSPRGSPLDSRGKLLPGGGKTAEKDLELDETKAYEINVTVDLTSGEVAMKANGATVTATLDRRLESVSYVGYAVLNPLTDFSPIEISPCVLLPLHCREG